MKTAVSAVLALLVAAPAYSQDAAPAVLPSKADAEKVLKASKVSSGASIGRLAVTSCNVLFANETGANAETQRGFGDSSAKRIESRVDVSYTMMGIEPAGLQALAEQICIDAGAQLAAAGYEMVPAAEVAARPEFVALHAKGKPMPYAYERSGSKYTNYGPAGEQVIDLTYLTMRDTFGAAFGAMSTDSPAFLEGALLSGLQASGAHVNVMVDFAKPKSNNVKGFLGKIAGNDTAKVETKMQLSVTGFMVLIPVENITCNNGICAGASDAGKSPRFTSKEPLLSGENAVLEVKDIQSGASKVDEVAGKVLVGVLSLGGLGGTMTDVERNGVVVDAAIYNSEVRRMAREFVSMAAVLARP